MGELDQSWFIKVCGVTDLDGVAIAAGAGASAVGFILTESARRVSPLQARSLSEAASGQLLRVAVFRHDADETVIEALDQVAVEIVQVHGTLSASLREALRTRGLRIVKALVIGSPAFAEFDESLVDAVLVDGPRPGSGEVHSWDQLHLRDFKVPVIAAGGLKADNVASTIITTGVWGVDVASGVESSPGVKDPTLVANFVGAARQAFNERGSK